MNNLNQISDAGSEESQLLGSLTCDMNTMAEYQGMVTDFENLSHNDKPNMPILDTSSQQSDVCAGIIDILQKLEHSLESWAALLYFESTIHCSMYFAKHDPLKDLKTNVTAATVVDPLQELSYTLKLIKTHAKDVDKIISEPEKDNQEQAMNRVVSGLSILFSSFISILAQVSSEDISYLFCDEVKLFAYKLMIAAKQFTNTLETIFELNIFGKQRISKRVDIYPILKSIHNLLNMCDIYLKLVDDGRLEFFKKMSKILKANFDKGIEVDLDLIDPVETRFDAALFTKAPLTSGKGLPPQSWTEDPQLLKQLGMLIFENIYLIEELLAVVHRRVSEKWKGTSIDAFYRSQSIIRMDTTIVFSAVVRDKYLNCDVDEKILRVNKICLEMFDHFRTKNVNSRNKEWWDLWELKFKTLSEMMGEYFYAEREYMAWVEQQDNVFNDGMNYQST